ncbi:hypothetical protein [Streptacidiphilus melanogenes]|uniref:hypothetical protein n=1 Tax=Streptacidiphilus melanogenes TaxID=411235 RepID=UPI0005A923E6|nr:hypothetical protein [Streptacidiphilus melanogenes]
MITSVHDEFEIVYFGVTDADGCEREFATEREDAALIRLGLYVVGRRWVSHRLPCGPDIIRAYETWVELAAEPGTVG